MKKKHVVEYGEIDIHKGTTAFWCGVATGILVLILLASVLLY